MQGKDTDLLYLDLLHPSCRKTPSEMDVVLGIDHLIKVVLDGIVWYLDVLHGIAMYATELDGMALFFFRRYSKVFKGI